MTFNWDGYKTAIEKELTIVNKQRQEVDFILNKAQNELTRLAKTLAITRFYILKARQLGMSAYILALFTIAFIFGKNERIVTIAHEASTTMRLFDRVKYYIASFERKNGIKIPLKYNSRSELVREDNGNTFYIGTAGSKSFGRGDTITKLHLPEFAFFPNPDELLAGVLQALVPDGLAFIETTANGFNEAKTFWDKSQSNETGFTPLFFDPSYEYTPEQLELKKKELGRLYDQEYPSSAELAFLTSGESYFKLESLKMYLDRVKSPIDKDLIYV